jgi:hypothetical protein
MDSAHENLSVESASFGFAFDVVQGLSVPWARATGTLNAREFCVQQTDVSIEPQGTSLRVSRLVLVPG